MSDFSKMRAAMSARAEIEVILTGEFPCRALPYGGVSDIARRVGVSKQRAHQIIADLGWNARTVRERARHACHACGATYGPPPHGRGWTLLYCSRTCWRRDITLTLVCMQCGRNFERTVHRTLTQLRKGAHRRFYCSRDCNAQALTPNRMARASPPSGKLANT